MLKVEMTKEQWKHLYERLMKPVTSRDGHAVYEVDVTLACDMRVAIDEALNGGK